MVIATSFEHRILIGAPRERVWQALTDPAELNRWETTEAHLDLRVGGDFLYCYAYGPSRPGTFLVVDPPHRLVQVNMVFNKNRSHRYVNSITLEAVGAGTRLRILVEGYGPGDDEQWLRESMDLGWETDLEILKAYVERGEDLRPQLWRGLLMGLRYVSHRGGGVRVLEALPGLPAERAGLWTDDVIVAVDGQPVQDFRGFRSLLRGFDPGGAARFEVLRDGRRAEMKVTFGDATAA